MNKKCQLRRIVAGATALVMALMPVSVALAADDRSTSMSVSPMNQSIILAPGDVYHGSFKVINPNSSVSDLYYEIEQKSFYVDEDYGTIFDEVDSPIVDWTTLDSDSTGVLEPNSSTDIKFTINVPSDAVGGGQYEAFWIKTADADVDGGVDNGAAIKETLVMAHLIFAEVVGSTLRQGEVVSIDVPGFLMSGKITAFSSIKNTGNIHGKAKYTLRVFPLFSDEEVYTNEEEPEEHIILPDRTFYNESVWNQTPTVGIFNVIYDVEFEGKTAQVAKMVIVCPVWLLFIIFFAVAAIIIWLVMSARGRKKRATRKKSRIIKG